jgi:hypothetical protein
MIERRYFYGIDDDFFECGWRGYVVVAATAAILPCQAL